MATLTILLTSLLAQAPPVADDDPEPPRVAAGPVTLKLVAKKKAYRLDTGGRTAKEYLEAIKAGRAAPVPVELELVITNNTNKTIRVQIRGNEVNRWVTGWTLTLSGKGAVRGGPYWSGEKDRPPAAFATLKSGGKGVIPLSKLTSHSASVQVYDHYWTEPGDYSISASLMVPVALNWDEQRSRGTFKTMTLKAPAIKLSVEK